MSNLSRRIFLDRYALKDNNKELVIGDVVVIVVKDDPKWPITAIGKISEILPEDEFIVELDEPTWDGAAVVSSVRVNREGLSIPIELEPRDMWMRVAHGLAAVETDAIRVAVEQELYGVLHDWSFVPGGRILAAAGTNQQLTMFNCYVVPSPKDSRGGIINTLSRMVEVMSRGGGVGINVSSLRPRRAKVLGVNGRSSGAVSWGALYSFATGMVTQGGCFAPSVLIATSKGLISAEDLYTRMVAGEDFHVQTHKGLRKIVDKFNNGVQEVCVLQTKEGFALEVTPNHRIVTVDDTKENLIMKSVRDISEGDTVFMLLGQPYDAATLALNHVIYPTSKYGSRLNTSVTFPEYMTPDLAYLLGFYNANGSNHIDGIRLSVCKQYPEVLEKLLRIAFELFNIQPRQNQGSGDVWEVNVFSRHLLLWLAENRLLKERCIGITIPQRVLESSSEVALGFIGGYIDADGCCGTNGIFIDSISHTLVKQTQVLLAANGIASRLYLSTLPVDRQNQPYRLGILSKTFRSAALIKLMQHSWKVANTQQSGVYDVLYQYPVKLFDNLGIAHKYYHGIASVHRSGKVTTHALRKVITLLKAAGDTARAAAAEEFLNYVPLKVISTTSAGAMPTYDFEVEEVHLLSGNGIYSSNSRRGALMLILEDWHPDLMEFIQAKMSPGYIENANMSVSISDAFMQAAQNNELWELIFPDTTHPKYNAEWDGNIELWKSKGYKVTVQGTVNAREVLRILTDAAWSSAEPGIVWLDRCNKQSNSYYYQTLCAVNPCAEQSLPPDGVCCLGHINLATVFHSTTGKVDWKKLREVILTAYRALDNVIDATPYFDAAVELESKRSRRIGMGTLGLAELLIKMKLPYRATPKTLAFIDRLYGFITCTLYEASSNMAKEKGSFEAFDANLFLESGFAKTLPDKIKALIRKQGLRNICLTTQAPTGSTGSMVGTSTGIEPFFAVRGIERKSRLGNDSQDNNVVEQWLLDNPGKKLPSYFVGAMDITPEDHIRIQAVIQRWTDSSISKTVNCANSTTRDEIFDLHLLAYDLGCKGLTIYRDGSRSEQVLTVNPDAEVYIEDDETVAAEEVDGHQVIFMYGARRCEACGNISMFDEDGCESCKVCGAGACSR